MENESIKRFTFRINTKLFERIKASAIKNRRCIGKEMECLLEKALEETQPKS